MRHGYWNQDRIEQLRSLVKHGHKNPEISRKLKIPSGVCEGYLSAAIRRYTYHECLLRRNKRQNQREQSETSRKQHTDKKSLFLKDEKENVPLIMRNIPLGIKLTEREKEQAQAADPLPPLHPLTGIAGKLSIFLDKHTMGDVL